jgi:hypothetical protein
LRWGHAVYQGVFVSNNNTFISRAINNPEIGLNLRVVN